MILSFTRLQATEQKILLLLTNPRTVSTAFELSIKARGDFTMLHEPWNCSYLYHHGGRDVFSHMPSQEVIEANGYEEVKALVLRHAEEGPLFVKDMIWSMGDEIANDDQLLSDPRLVLAFLIREPALSIESYFVKGRESMPVERVLQLCTSVIRYDGLYKIAEKYHKLCGKWPIIVESEEVCRDPKQAFTAFCQQAGIAYLDKALCWQTGLPTEWNQFEAWHKDAAVSTGFFVPKRHELEKRFSLIPEEYVPLLEEAYQKQLPYYLALKSLKQGS